MGVVLQPEIIDAHGDIISKEVIEEAADNFLANYNKVTKTGVQHSRFFDDFEILQSYVTLVDLPLGTKEYPAGSWIVKGRVNNDEVWQAVKKGKLTGFSIGGTGKAIVYEDQEGSNDETE